MTATVLGVAVLAAVALAQVAALAVAVRLTPRAGAR